MQLQNLYNSLASITAAKHKQMFILIITLFLANFVICSLFLKVNWSLVSESFPFIVVTLGFEKYVEDLRLFLGHRSKHGVGYIIQFVFEISVLTSVVFLNIPTISEICLLSLSVFCCDFLLLYTLYPYFLKQILSNITHASRAKPNPVQSSVSNSIVKSSRKPSGLEAQLDPKEYFDVFSLSKKGNYKLGLLLVALSCLFGSKSPSTKISLESGMNFPEMLFCFSFVLNLFLGVQYYFSFGDKVSTGTNTDTEFQKPSPPVSPSVSTSSQFSLPSPLSDTTEDDSHILHLLKEGKVASHSLEKYLSNDYYRAIFLRRQFLFGSVLDLVPFEHYDYSKVIGACCENVVGYVPIPLGVAGPYLVDNNEIFLPMATTEGCLIASTSRGCKAISLSGGAITLCFDDGMTRAPVLEFESISASFAFKKYVEDMSGLEEIRSWFESTSRYAKLISLSAKCAGRLVYIRFKCFTGDAMGMNMISKGVELVLENLLTRFDCKVISISGNYCTDKKPAAVNWIEGRGKSVLAEAIVKKEVVEKVLKTTVKDMVELNLKKNLIGSAMAGSVGGFNAHAANILTAMYLACGQDPAQNVESSQCITLMEEQETSGDLYISVTMPCVEVGTVGGGTGLSAQKSCLSLLGVNGPSDVPGTNAKQLARFVSAGVLAGELSLCAALAAGHLVKSHMQHNRAKVKPTEAGTCLR